jgi:hypothetical protein
MQQAIHIFIQRMQALPQFFALGLRHLTIGFVAAFKALYVTLALMQSARFTPGDLARGNTPIDALAYPFFTLIYAGRGILASAYAIVGKLAFDIGAHRIEFAPYLFALLRRGIAIRFETHFTELDTAFLLIQFLSLLLRDMS